MSDELVGRVYRYTCSSAPFLPCPPLQWRERRQADKEKQNTAIALEIEVPYRGTDWIPGTLGASLIPYTSELSHDQYISLCCYNSGVNF